MPQLEKTGLKGYPMLQCGYKKWRLAGMNIRRAKEKDIERVMELLGQVLQIHADIRPDIFIPGTTKYTKERQMEYIL